MHACMQPLPATCLALLLGLGHGPVRHAGASGAAARAAAARTHVLATASCVAAARTGARRGTSSLALAA